MYLKKEISKEDWRYINRMSEWVYDELYFPSSKLKPGVYYTKFWINYDGESRSKRAFEGMEILEDLIDIERIAYQMDAIDEITKVFDTSVRWLPATPQGVCFIIETSDLEELIKRTIYLEGIISEYLINTKALTNPIYEEIPIGQYALLGIDLNHPIHFLGIPVQNPPKRIIEKVYEDAHSIEYLNQQIELTREKYNLNLEDLKTLYLWTRSHVLPKPPSITWYLRIREYMNNNKQ